MRKVKSIHSAVIAVITAIMIVSVLLLVSVNYVLSDRIRSVSATDTAAEEALSASLRHDQMIASYVRVPSADEDFEDDEVTIILDGEHSGTGVIGSHYDYDEVMAELEKVENLDLNSVEELFEYGPGEIVLEPTHRKMFNIKLIEPGKDKVIEAVEDLLELDMILSAEAKYNYETVDMSISSSSDPYYDQQWGLNGTYGINVEDAWDIADGSGVRVGIFEDGAYSAHEDLSGRIAGSNFSAATNTEHGTHVAGIISATRDNNKGIAGISKATLYILNRDNFISSLSYAADNNIKIINVSYFFW